VKWVPGLSCG